ncbi:hypothetical protein B4110_3565 [Parageobacillus toebii]|uniref:Uncharacterized protein n=1 Tax=Parageobacillus toebii TaxID=153151 RepID=A0A150N8Z8_9BACL|nr:hypothetical protein B4110_3565 [Parageobacillus toebii]
MAALRYVKFHRCDLQRAFFMFNLAKKYKNASTYPLFALNSRFDAKRKWML